MMCKDGGLEMLLNRQDFDMSQPFDMTRDWHGLLSSQFFMEQTSELEQ